jgi:hypothetical protein
MFAHATVALQPVVVLLPRHCPNLSSFTPREFEFTAGPVGNALVDFE